jgi:hypothetical protein
MLLALSIFCFVFIFSCYCTHSDRLFNLDTLALSEKLRAKRASESAQVVKNVELEVVMRSQAKKITELEMAYADLKCQKDNVTTGYRRLAAKHDAFTEKAEQEKTKLAEAHGGAC